MDLQVIEAVDIDGKNRRVLVSSAQHPYGVTIVGDVIYWTDWELQAVVRASKETGAAISVLHDNLPGLMDIHAVQLNNIRMYPHLLYLIIVILCYLPKIDLCSYKCAERSACGDDNGGCSHLCLRTPSGSSCACPTGIHLKSDKRNCYQYPHKSLFFASTTNLQRISLDTDHVSSITLDIQDVSKAIGLSFHYRLGRLYFTDVHHDVIRYGVLFMFS